MHLCGTSVWLPSWRRGTIPRATGPRRPEDWLTSPGAFGGTDLPVASDVRQNRLLCNCTDPDHRCRTQTDHSCSTRRRSATSPKRKNSPCPECRGLRAVAIVEGDPVLPTVPTAPILNQHGSHNLCHRGQDDPEQALIRVRRRTDCRLPAEPPQSSERMMASTRAIVRSAPNMETQCDPHSHYSRSDRAWCSLQAPSFYAMWTAPSLLSV